MPPPYAQEFTSELSESYLANQLNLRSNQEAASVGAAHEEGEEGGLVGQAAEGSRVGAAEDNANKGVNDAVTGFNLDVAGKQYSERMTDAREAFADIRLRTIKISAPKGCEIGITHWVAR